MKIVEKCLKRNGSPYLTAPKRARTICNYWIQQQKLQITSPFCPAPSLTNKCTKKLGPGDKYYECFQCVVQNSSRTRAFYLCTDCFREEDHIGHFYKCDVIVQSYSNSNSNSFCSCGKDLNGEDSGIRFCKKHVEEDVIFRENNQKYQQIHEFFKPLYEIIFYLTEVELEQADDERSFRKQLKLLFRSVHKLVAEMVYDSVYYIRMFTDFMINCIIKNRVITEQEQQIQQPLKEFTVLEFILLFKGLIEEQCEKVFLAILSDNKSASKLLIALDKFMSNKNENQSNQTHMSERLLIETNHISKNIIENLASQDIFLFSFLFPSYSIYSKRTKSSQIFMKMTKALIKNQDNSESTKINKIANYLNQSDPHYLSQDDQIYLIKYFIKLFQPEKKNQTVQKKDLNQLQNGNENQPKVDLKKEAQVAIQQLEEPENVSESGDNQENQEQDNEISAMLPILNQNSGSEVQDQGAPQVAIYSQVIGERIYALFKGDASAIIDCRNRLINQDININHIQSFTKWAVDNIDFGGSLELIPSRFVMTTIMLMGKSPKSNQLVESFWKSVFSKPSLDKIFRNIWSLLFLLIDQKLLRWSNRANCYKDTFNLLIQNQHNLDVSDEITKSIDEMQIQYLYQFKEIPQHQISQLRLILDNKRFGLIMQEYCKYDRDRNKFVYTSEEKHENKLIILLKAIETLKQNNVAKFKYQQDSNTYTKMISQDENHRQLRQKIFASSIFLDQIKQLWQSVIQSLEDQQSRIESFRQSKKLQSFLQLLVMIRNVCEHQFTQLQQYISQMRSESFLAELYILGDKEQIDQILCIKPQRNGQANHNKEISIDNQKKIQKMEENNSLKKKSESKKKRITDQMKEKRQKALANLSTNSLSLLAAASLQSEQQCLICHEREKQDNKLAYMLDIVKDNTLCSAIFQQKNTTKTFLTSCFHSIHVQCFISTKGNNRYLRCPLCSKPQNTIFPINYNKNDKKINLICENMMKMAVIAIYDVYDVDNWFLMFLEYLVEAKAMHSMMFINHYDSRRKKRQRVDNFVEGRLQTMYHEANQFQKVMYDQLISSVQAKIDHCPDENFKSIQKLIFSAVVSKLKTGESKIEMSQLESLASKLNSKEFMIVRNEIEQLGVKTLHSKIQKQQAPEQQQNKVAFQLKKLPQNWRQLPKLGGKRCSSCKSFQKALFCLICGETLCLECENSQSHQTRHKKRSMSFLFSESILSLRTQSSSLQSDVYFNEIQTSIRKWDQSSMIFDTFKLDNKVFDKVQQMFMDDV